MEVEFAPNSNEAVEALVKDTHMKKGELASKQMKQEILSDEDS